jgi:uncharacterized cupin superfamily protein
MPDTMRALNVIRFPANAADVPLEPWPDLPAEIVESGNPQQRGKMLFEDKASGISAGIWDCTTFIGKQETYPVTEFMLVLEGSVTVFDAHGGSVTISAGESFVMPKGMVCRWHQPDYMRKFFVILDDAKIPPENADARVVKLSHDHKPAQVSTPTAADLLISGTPQQHLSMSFEDGSHQFTVGFWDTTRYHRRAIPFPHYELMHFLEGGVSITDAAGNRQQFAAGDTMFVPKGAVADFKVESDYLRKIFVIFAPA